MKLDKVGTFASVFVNDQLVAELANLHRVHYVNLGKAKLREGANKLRIRIDSTIRKTVEAKLKYGDKQPRVGPWFDNQWKNKSFVEFARTQ